MSGTSTNAPSNPGANEGFNCQIKYVVGFQKLIGEFTLLPVAGFEKCESLTRTCMIDLGNPLTREQRLQPYDVQYSPPVRSDTFIFMRIDAGNEPEMQNAIISGLNAEMEGLTDQRDRIAQYTAMVDLYDEYVPPRMKVRHRRNVRQSFASEPRTKFGRQIKTTNDIMTLGSDRLYVRPPSVASSLYSGAGSGARSYGSGPPPVYPLGRGPQTIPPPSTATIVNLDQRTRTSAAFAPEPEVPPTPPATQQSSQTRGQPEQPLVPPEENVQIPVEPEPEVVNLVSSETASGTGSSTLTPDPTPVSSGAAKRSAPQGPDPGTKRRKRRSAEEIAAEEREKAERKRKREADAKAKKDAAAVAKADKDLQKLVVQAKKAKRFTEQQKILRTAREYIAGLNAEQRRGILEKYGELLQDDNEIRFSRSGNEVGESSGETSRTPQPSAAVASVAPPETAEPAPTSAQPRGRTPSAVPPGETSDETASPRRNVPPSPAQRKSVTSARKRVMEDIVNQIREQEGEVADELLGTPRDPVTSGSSDPDEVHLPPPPSTRVLRSATRNRGAAQLLPGQSRTAVLFERLDNLDRRVEETSEQITYESNQLYNYLNRELVTPMRDLVKDVAYIKTVVEKDRDKKIFDSSIAKHRLRQLTPFYDQFDSITYMLSKIEICEAFVEMFKEHMRLGTNAWDINDLGNNFINFFLSVELGAHSYWNSNPSKAEAGQAWDKIPVLEAVRNLWDNFISRLASVDGKRAKTDGSRDSKVQKLQNLRSDYFSFLIKDNPNKNLYEYLKARYADKLFFYRNVKIQFVPEGEEQDEPPSLPEDIEMYVRTHLKGKKNLKLAELDPPGRNISMDLKRGQEFSREVVDDLSQLLRACGYGNGKPDLDDDGIQAIVDKFGEQIAESVNLNTSFHVSAGGGGLTPMHNPEDDYESLGPSVHSEHSGFEDFEGYEPNPVRQPRTPSPTPSQIRLAAQSKGGHGKRSTPRAPRKDTGNDPGAGPSRESVGEETLTTQEKEKDKETDQTETQTEK